MQGGQECNSLPQILKSFLLDFLFDPLVVK